MKKMFIAGAKCTQCGAEDKVKLCIDGDREWIECVACGHSEERPKEVTPKDPEEHHAHEHDHDHAEDSVAVKWFPKK